MQVNLSQLRKRCKMTHPPGQQIAKGLWYTDNGCDILAVAHLDYVPQTKHFQIVHIRPGGRIISSGQLDDRLGVYTILDLLPAYGLRYDVLLTTDEERCASTARLFSTEKKYKWVFSFDRAGDSDVALYQYQNKQTMDAIRAAGLHPTHGSYSDIVELDHLGCAGFNWCTGLEDGHSPMAHVSETDYLLSVCHFLKFWEANHEIHFPYEQEVNYSEGDFCDLCGQFARDLYLTDDGILMCPNCNEDPWESECDLCGKTQVTEYSPAHDAFLCELCFTELEGGK